MGWRLRHTRLLMPLSRWPRQPIPRRRVIIVGAGFCLSLGISCNSPNQPSEAPRPDTQDVSQAPAAKPQNTQLRKVCERAFDLIENNEPGSVPRRKAVALANEAFFIDDSIRVTEAFSNLNNVYVFDDGTSSEEEVRRQLEDVCP